MTLARIIIDPQDASKDKHIDSQEARKLYESGKLAYDITNRCYTTKGH